jgi:hypothetical protein
LDIRGTVCHHRDLDQSAATYGIAFHHIPVTAQTEARLLEIAAAEKIELVLPARCMQVLSDAVCRQFDGCASTSTTRSCAASRASNPAFDRGVKIIGATAHRVTAALDELDAIADSLNGRPRATHAFRSPLQVFAQMLSLAHRPSTQLHWPACCAWDLRPPGQSRAEQARQARRPQRAEDRRQRHARVSCGAAVARRLDGGAAADDQGMVRNHCMRA